ncbi:MAG: CBS domain-containing protein [Vallitaleaceae bacterium]|nr:CBS domain-containing protein [Vallitaleaceae bacterium]
MNVAFLLTPKSDIVTLRDTMTLRQAMEKMEYHKYSAVPVIDRDGRYIYTLSEGDILWYLKDSGHLDLRGTEEVVISEVPRSRTIDAVSINEDIDYVLDLTRFQNFVPVVDDSGIFIGMVKRSDLMISSIYAHRNRAVSRPTRLIAQSSL